MRIDEGSEKKRRKEKREKRERVCMRGRRERMNEKYDYMNEKERIVSFIGEKKIFHQLCNFLILSNKKKKKF